MGLSDRAQAAFMFVSGLFMAVGTGSATIPSDLPAEWKLYLFTGFWALGLLGFALKEALGGQPKAA